MMSNNGFLMNQSDQSFISNEPQSLYYYYRDSDSPFHFVNNSMSNFFQPLTPTIQINQLARDIPMRPIRDLQNPAVLINLANRSPSIWQIYLKNQSQPKSQQAKLEYQIQEWVYDNYLYKDKTSLEDIMIKFGQKNNKKGKRVDERMLQKCLSIYKNEFKNDSIKNETIRKILSKQENQNLDSINENLDLLLRFLKEIQRKYQNESLHLKEYFGLLTNPVDLNKNQNTQINEDRFPTIKQYFEKCNDLAKENKINEMNQPKKVIRALIHRMGMRKYWIEKKVMHQKFDNYQYRHLKPIYLARLLKKIALEMGQNGNGKYETNLLQKKKVIQNDQYESYIEKAIVDLDLDCK